MSDGRQWTLQRDPDRSVVHGPYTGSEVVTVVPVSQLEDLKVEQRPGLEAEMLKVNADQAFRLKQVAADNSRLREANAELREQLEAAS